MDPQDLLYTNNFISPTLISQNEIKNVSKNYSEFNKIFKKEIKYTNRSENNFLENNPENVNKVNQELFQSKNKNRYPIFDKGIQDITSNKYKKLYKTNLYIYSKDRNPTLNLFPSDYNIQIPKSFNNIKKIVFKDMYLPNYITPINDENNILAWQYLNLDVLNNEKINYDIIPCIKNVSIKGIPYSNLKNSYSEVDLNELTKKCYLKYANPSIEDFNDYIRSETKKINHNILIENPYKDEIKQETDLRSVKPTLIYFDINTENNKVEVINRIEELEICSIQTFGNLTLSEINNYDIFNNYITTNFTTSQLNDNSVYITLVYNSFLNNFINNSGFPLIITQCIDVGGINKEVINMTEIYDENLYNNFFTMAVSKENLETVSHYKFFDLIEIGDTKLLRLEIKFSTGNMNNNLYTEKGEIIGPVYPEQKILNHSLDEYFKNGETYTNFKLIYNYDNRARIGRAICFRLVNDTRILNNEISEMTQQQLLDENIIECNLELKQSILIKLFKWNVDNTTYNLKSFNYKYQSTKFKFIHSNYDNVLYRLNSPVNNLFDPVSKTIPQIYTEYNLNIIQLDKKLEIEKFDNKHYFRVQPFVYVRLTFNDKSKNDINSQNLRCVDAKRLQFNNMYNRYLESLYENVNYIEKNTNNITCKIKLNNIYSQSNDHHYEINEELFFYDKLLNELDNVKVEILNYDGKIVDNIFENCITLEIYEEIDVLKETLIDSKTGNINTTGKFF